MAEQTVIAKGAFLRGNVRGEGDLAIDGRVEGDVSVTGDVTIGASGLVKANVQGARITVRGAVAGDLVGEEAVVLEDGARVVGSVSAPRIGIGAGALVRGRVETTDASRPARAAAKPASTTRQAPASRQTPARVETPAKTPAKPAEVARPAPAPRAAPVAAVRPAPPVAVKAVAAPPPPPPPSAPRTAPPPVVPSLKKGAKGALKKKAGS